jgi:hypothetical protein
MSPSFHVVWFDPLRSLNEQRVLASRRNTGAVGWAKVSPNRKRSFGLL